MLRLRIFLLSLLVIFGLASNAQTEIRSPQFNFWGKVKITGKNSHGGANHPGAVLELGDDASLGFLRLPGVTNLGSINAVERLLGYTNANKRLVYYDGSSWRSLVHLDELNGIRDSMIIKGTFDAGKIVLRRSFELESNDTIDLKSFYVPYSGATTNVDLGTHRLTARSLRMDSVIANGSGGAVFVTNSGNTSFSYGAGGSSEVTFNGFAGYNANRASSYTARSFTDKNYVDSADALRLLKSDSATYYDKVVRTFGTQTIGGNKTFDNDITLNGMRVGRGVGNDASNTVFGTNVFGANSGGARNTAFGERALASNTSGVDNTGIGWYAVDATTTGGGNVGVGSGALGNNTTGSNNIGIGYGAGEFITGLNANSTGNNSIFIGYNAKAAGNAQTNQTVIGYNATGNGSNTVTIGNSSVTDNYFTGNIRGGAFIRSGGTSSQFLKADGSVDNNTYLTSSDISGKLNISDTAAMLSNYRRTTTKITNSDLVNSAITINGSSTSLGGSISVGTVTSVGLSVPTGFSVSNTPINSNGTIALSFASGYALPTTAKQSEWDVAYNKRLSSANLSTSQLTLTLADASTVTASVPTFNQNTTGTAGSLSAVLSSSLGGAGSVSGILKANGSGVVSAAVAGDITSLISGTYLPLSAGASFPLTGTLHSSGVVNVLTAQVAGTARRNLYFSNTNTDITLGIESETGGSTFSGSTAYAALIGTSVNRPIEFFTNNAKRLTIAGDGVITTTAQLNGTKSIFNGSSGETFTANGVAGEWTGRINGSSSVNNSYGLIVNGGTSTSDIAFKVTSQSGLTDYLVTRGDGQTTIRKAVIGGGSGELLTVNGVAGDWAQRINGSSSSGNSSGLIIAAGTNSSDFALNVFNQGVTASLFNIKGDGTTTLTGALNGTSAAFSGNVDLGFNNNLRLGTSPFYYKLTRSSSGTLITYFDDEYDVSNSSVQFRMRTAGTPLNALTIFGTANIGIKTTTDNGTDALQVAGSGLFSGAVTMGRLATYANNASPSATTNVGMAVFESSSSVQLQMGGIDASPFSFWMQTKQSNNSGSVFPLSINPMGGNVGIGTTNPTRLFHIYKPSTESDLFIESDLAQQASLYFKNGTNAIYVPSAASGEMRFFVNSADRLTIASTGAATFSSSVTVGGALSFSPSSSKIVSGVTDFAIRNNADNTSMLHFNNSTLAATFAGSVYGVGFKYAHNAVSSNYTLTDNDDYINVTSSCTITLPTAVGRSGKRYVIKCVGTVTATIASTSSQTIDGNAASSYSFGGPNFNILIVYSDGSNWFTEAFTSGS